MVPKDLKAAWDVPREVSAGSASGSLVLVIVADTGVDRSVSPDPARGIFATFRLL
ncbi:hypothetical protein ACFYTS_02175 [Nocardia sp. NPDC004151]|uniref:hypothetical protein n=1 Tax=Nocardia sp. NPDC004151 TaxID=3364304 RepID=UPI0036C85968